MVHPLASSTLRLRIRNVNSSELTNRDFVAAGCWVTIERKKAWVEPLREPAVEP
jgi:hypothetical protein